MHVYRFPVVVVHCLLILYAAVARGSDDPSPPARPVRLIFIHHSTGENTLADDYGGLGKALRDNQYYVSDTNYGWGPDSIGDTTDIGHWWTWFRGLRASAYLTALFAESGQHASYSRLTGRAPGANNRIIMFKSCFPNSALQGSKSDPVPVITNNPLRGQDAGSDVHTVANAKGIYIDILKYFATRQDKLFIAVTAPPLSDGTYAANARAFNEGLCGSGGWLKNYPYKNVFVFDFYNVLTTNGGNADKSDLGKSSGNHHRWWNGAVQHKSDVVKNVLAYPSDDDHPNPTGSKKATIEFVPLLNVAYHRWQASLAAGIMDDGWLKYE